VFNAQAGHAAQEHERRSRGKRADVRRWQEVRGYGVCVTRGGVAVRERSRAGGQEGRGSASREPEARDSNIAIRNRG
jgi:hypothetical protein